MKKLLFLLLPLACVLAGCKYDDSDVWDEIDSQKARIAALETLTSTMNSNISSLQSIVTALQGNVTINSVTATSDGYVIYFSDGTKATISNGTDGKTPDISVKADADGTYYWTIDGEWLLDASGNKVSATGKTPKLKIEDDQWYVSYDDGASWTKVTGQSASLECLFKSVETDADNAIFTLADGTVITVPLANTAVKLQLLFDESVFEKMRGGEVLSTTYTILAKDDAEVTFDTFENDGWTVTIYPADDRSGRISIKSPETVTTSKVLFFLSDDQGGSFVKIITIGYNPEAKPAVTTEYSVGPDGGELIIPVMSCTAELSEGAEEWITVTSVGDQVVLNLKSNETYDWRQCQLTLEDGTVINITQITRDALVLSSSEIEIDGRRQKVSFVVSTNIRVTATVEEGSDWLTVSPASRGLADKVFTFTATRNTTGEARVAKVTFAGNDLSETCTITQAVYEGSSAIDVTEAVAASEGEEIELSTSLVTALTTDGYVVADEDNAIYVEDSHVVAKGTSVSFDAVVTSLNGILALGSIQSFSKDAEGAAVTYPKATDITSDLDTYEASSAEYVSVKGVLSFDEDGNAIVTVGEAARNVLVYKPETSLGISEDIAGHTVTVYGYYYGVSGDSIYVIAANFEDNGGSQLVVIGYNYKKVTTVTSGKSYIIAAIDGTTAYVGQPITSNYGYIQKVNATDNNGVITLDTRDSEFVITAASSGYTIVQPDGRYVYQTGTYNSFNVAASPSSGQYWTITGAGDGTFTILNTSVNKYIQYSTSYNSYGSYASAQNNSILPSLYEYDGEAYGSDDNPGGGDEPGGETGAFTSNVEWELGTNSYTQAAFVNGGSDEVTVLKLGTAKSAGSATVTLPAGTSKLSFYAVSWKGNAANLVINDASGNELYSVTPAANDGATGNPTYAISVSDSDFYTYNLGSALTSAKTVTITTSGSKYRVILFGINAN